MKCCGDCDFYRWIEDLYGDGSYVEYEYCEDDEARPCGAKTLRAAALCRLV